MALDLAALRAKIAAQKAAAIATSSPSEEIKNETNTLATANASNLVSSNGINSNSNTGISSNNNSSNPDGGVPAPTVNAPAKLGTSKTTEIDHMDFLAKMNSLSEAIHKQHPTMPVLLMQIHKQLRADPELVATLDEDAIGIIVKGLQVQTKTELVAAATSTKSKSKKVALDVSML